MIKTALVTGASGGIGSAIAERLASDGFRIIAAYNSDSSGADALKEKIEKAGGECTAVKLDVSDPQAVNALAEKAGSIDVLVNCAGAALRKMVTDTTDEEFEKLCGVNFRGVFNTCRACVPSMVKAKKGKIINISSMWGCYGASCEAVYSATKAAVIGFSQALARELAPSNIQVNCVAPGAIDTKMNNDLTAEEKAEFAEEIPVGRFGRPEEIAGIVSFLAGDDSSYVTAQTITADGGLT